MEGCGVGRYSLHETLPLSILQNTIPKINKRQYVLSWGRQVIMKSLLNLKFSKLTAFFNHIGNLKMHPQKNKTKQSKMPFLNILIQQDWEMNLSSKKANNQEILKPR